MIVTKTAAVNLLVDLGFPGASEWDDAKILKKIKLVPTKVTADDVSAEFRPLLKELIDAKGEIDLEEGAGEEDNEEESPAKKEVIDVDAMDKATIRAFIEERKIDIKIRAKDSIASVKEKLKKVLAAQAAAAPAKGKAKSVKVKKDGAKSTTKSTVEKDKYGCRLGSIRAKTNVAFSRVWKTIAQIEKETGVPPGKINGNLADQVRSGLLEVQKVDGKNQFRLAK